MTTETGKGRADLHIHTLASDGVSSVADILAAAEAIGLDVIAITDHERVDAAHAARKMAEARA
jgi:predicted metal-dependent phosphoesterase TrpH